MSEFNPFSRHASPNLVQNESDLKTAEATGVDQPIGGKPSPANPFGRHGGEKKPSIERRLRRALKLEPAQLLLDWLIQDQTKTFISARDICRLGPGQIRKLECAIEAARILTENGWLIPLETRRRDMRWWQVVRKPLLCPTVAATL
jgi:hypothetical protein